MCRLKKYTYTILKVFIVILLFEESRTDQYMDICSATESQLFCVKVKECIWCQAGRGKCMEKRLSHECLGSFTTDPYSPGSNSAYQSPPSSYSYPSPSNPSSSYGSPSYGSPSYGSPSYGSPSYGSPSYGSPSYQPTSFPTAPIQPNLKGAAYAPGYSYSPSATYKGFKGTPDYTKGTSIYGTPTGTGIGTGAYAKGYAYPTTSDYDGHKGHHKAYETPIGRRNYTSSGTGLYSNTGGYGSGYNYTHRSNPTKNPYIGYYKGTGYYDPFYRNYTAPRSGSPSTHHRHSQPTQGNRYPTPPPIQHRHDQRDRYPPSPSRTSPQHPHHHRHRPDYDPYSQQYDGYGPIPPPTQYQPSYASPYYQEVDQWGNPITYYSPHHSVHTEPETKDHTHAHSPPQDHSHPHPHAHITLHSSYGYPYEYDTRRSIPLYPDTPYPSTYGVPGGIGTYYPGLSPSYYPPAMYPAPPAISAVPAIPSPQLQPGYIVPVYRPGYFDHPHDHHHHNRSIYNPNRVNMVQLNSQRINLKLRDDQSHRLTVKYSPKEIHYLDVYYLVDVSQPMDHLENEVVAMGKAVLDKLESLTSNFRVGFGTFGEKFPPPCQSCDHPYGFYNQLPLSTNLSAFLKELDEFDIEDNSFPGKMCLDAMMQAIVCDESLGWKENARKFLIIPTSGDFLMPSHEERHEQFPNDGLCHMEHDRYIHMPGIVAPNPFQLNIKIKGKHLIVVMLVPKEYVDVCQHFVQHIDRTVCVSFGTGTTTQTVTEIIKDEYNKILSHSHIKDNAPDSIKISYQSACLPNQETCEPGNTGDTSSFTADFTVQSCPANPRDWYQTIDIHPEGANGTLTVDVEMHCGCNHTDKNIPRFEKNSKLCNGGGDFDCGVCICQPNRIGKHCEHFVEGHYGDAFSDCRGGNHTDVDCNGRGTCVGGYCECDRRLNEYEIITGKYCECDNFLCDEVNGLLCSGPERGICDCGKCLCKPGWSGPACTCSESVETCRSPYGMHDVCSEHGQCVCGSCRCDSDEYQKYSGKFCEECETCTETCEELEKCVACKIFGTGDFNPSVCAIKCDRMNIKTAEHIIPDKHKGEIMCKFYDEKDCLITFAYSGREFHQLEIRAEEKAHC